MTLCAASDQAKARFCRLSQNCIVSLSIDDLLTPKQLTLIVVLVFFPRLAILLMAET